MLKEILLSGIDYSAYKLKIENYLNNTNPELQNEEQQEKFAYTKLNLQRMSRIDRTYSPSPQMVSRLNMIDSPQTWAVITEGWCGDSAQNIPYLVKIASLNPRLSFVLVERDSNPAIMDSYLSNGARSIPKLIVFDKNGQELFQWGPRPKPAGAIVRNLKAEGKTKKEWEEILHLWYAKNRGAELERELMELLSAVTTEPLA